MRKSVRTMAVMAGLLILAASSQAVFANCTNFGAGFPVFQCTSKAFFQAPPAGAGSVSAAWWQLGYGNKGVANGFGSGPQEGTAMGPGTTFSGNDNGNFSIVLTSAQAALPGVPGIPAGVICSNVENSWSQPGVDGCADIPRTAADNDNKLNRYYNSYGPGYYSTDYQLDYPMGILLTEGSGQFFSIAFVASHPRGTTQTQRAADSSDGFFDLGDVSVNGLANPALPGKTNMIPWQAIPRQRVDMVTFTNDADRLHSPRQLALSWVEAKSVHDGSVRPSARSLNNPGNGVGVTDQGPLIRYIVEVAHPVSGAPDPNTAWTVAASTTTTSASVTVDPDSAIRLRTVFGKTPDSAALPTLDNARQGKLGDLGFEVISTPTLIAGELISERAVNVVASRNKNSIDVRWESTSELTTTGFEILGDTGKGTQKIKVVACKECTNGKPATYAEQITAAELKGSKTISIRMVGPGTVSEPVTVK